MPFIPLILQVYLFGLTKSQWEGLKVILARTCTEHWVNEAATAPHQAIIAMELGINKRKKNQKSRNWIRQTIDRDSNPLWPPPGKSIILIVP